MVSLHSVDFLDLNKAFLGGRWGLAVACLCGCVGVLWVCLGEGGHNIRTRRFHVLIPVLDLINLQTLIKRRNNKQWASDIDNILPSGEQI